jgi:hypothetical protein
MKDYPIKYQELNLKFRHVASGQEVEFLPFITNFEDSYEQQWNPVEVFGKMDAIKTFKRTMRTITIGFDVPSSTFEEGEENFAKCKKLLQMNYPVYHRTIKGVEFDPSNSITSDPLIKKFRETAAGISADTEDPTARQVKNLSNKLDSFERLFQPKSGIKDSSIITAPPVLQVKFGNLINDGTDGYLYGTIQGMSYTPDVEMGFWTYSGKTKKFAGKDVGYVPKVVSFSLTFEVLHTKPLGYDSNKRSSGNTLHSRNLNFPYKK